MRTNNPKRLFIAFVGLLLTLLLLLIVRGQWTKQNRIPVVRVPQQVTFYTTEQISQLTRKQIQNGDFSALAGRWRSKDGTEDGLQFAIADNCLLIADKRYYLRFSGKNTDDAIYLEQYENKNASPIIYYPSGAKIPIMMPDGQVDTSGLYDPSDQTQPRILLGQTTLSAELVEKLTTYLSD